MTGNEIDEFRRAYAAAMKRDTLKFTVYPPLPRRVRLRLRAARTINGAGIWLVDHGHITAAVTLWRICRMW